MTMHQTDRFAVIRALEMARREQEMERWAEVLEEAALALRKGDEDLALKLTGEVRASILRRRVGDR
jgi:hypothetical protein